MIGFTLSEEQRMIRDLARDFAEKEILPLAEEHDQSGEFPWSVVRKAQEVEMMNLNIPEEYEGPDLGVLEECIVNEELAYACSGIQTALMLNSLAAWPILLAGDEGVWRSATCMLTGRDSLNVFHVGGRARDRSYFDVTYTEPIKIGYGTGLKTINYRPSGGHTKTLRGCQQVRTTYYIKPLTLKAKALIGAIKLVGRLPGAKMDRDGTSRTT